MFNQIQKTKFYSTNKNTILLINLFLGAALFLSACSDAEQQYVKGTTKLRCDGVYKLISDQSAPAPNYLRFFAEGGATSCGNILNLSPEDAYKKMISADGSINSYGNVYRTTSFTLSDVVNVSVAADGSSTISKSPDIVFEFQIQGGLITYSGTIGDNTLDFEVYGTLSGRSHTCRYEFIPVKD